MMRSKLFVPAVRPEWFEKALHSGADAICFDLEDTVASERKLEARRYVESFLSGLQPSSSPLLLVRSNAVVSPHFSQDLTASVWPSLFAIALPKVESVAEIATAADLLTEIERSRKRTAPVCVLPTIESPRGLRLAAEIASSSPRVIGLQIGFADLLEPLGIAPTNTFARNQIRLQVRLAAAEAGLDCYDSAVADFKDIEGYKRELKAASSLGFAGGSCIHPTQISVANIAFTPTTEVLRYAQRIVDAAELAEKQAYAVTSVDGKMIDRPFILRAKRLLARKYD